MEDYQNITHSKEHATFLKNIKDKIIQRGDLPHVSVQRQLEIVEELCQFEFGRFILERKGANGFWTDYLISYPKEISSQKNTTRFLNSTENYLFNLCPVALAHRERFQLYQQLVQSRLKDNMVLASIPCGLMRDLLTLDYSGIKNIELIGVDIDDESIELAEIRAKEKGIKNVTFLEEDAWQIKFDQELDIIVSSGLNVYEPDPLKVQELYHKFFDALKPNGILIISLLTYPPGELDSSGKPIKTDWILDNITSESILMNKILFQDILETKWRNFKSSNELDQEFKSVGFSNISIYFDSRHIFPTVVAQRGS